MFKGVVLLSQDVEGVMSPVGPEALAASGPLWSRQLDELGPLTPVRIPLASGASLTGLHAAEFDAPSGVLVCGECGSTMDAARWLAEQGVLGDWDGVAAVRQVTGRGQLRRPWSSPAGNLHITFRWPGPPGEKFDASSWDVLTPLIAGWLFSECLEKQGAPTEIKWPNDMLWRGRKIGGVLAEARGDAVVVGLGLNLVHAPKPAEMRAESAVEAVSLHEAGLDIPPLSLWRLLANCSQNCYINFLYQAGPKDFLQRFSRRMAWTGYNVMVREGDRPPYRARILGVADDGGLRLARNGGELTLYSGSVSEPEPPAPRRPPADVDE